MQAYDQPSAAPVPKVAAGGIAGSITVVMLFLLNEIWAIEVTGEVASAITTIIIFFTAYMTRDKKPDAAIPIIQNEKTLSNGGL